MRLLYCLYCFQLLGTYTLGNKTSAFPWRIVWASVCSFVAVLVLMALVFFLRRFFLKRGNNTTACAWVSLLRLRLFNVPNYQAG